MRLLLADRLPEQTITELESRGHVCVMEPGLHADDLPGRIPGFDALVVRSTKVKRAVFEAADRLVLVIRAGAGTNTIDTDAAASRGVFVSNVPGRNAAAVAELTMGLLLALDRRIADNVSDLRAGHWDKQRYSKAEGLLGSTMGIIGLGAIGFSVAERAAAFGIRAAVARQARPVGVRRVAGRGAGHHDVRLDGGAGVVQRHRDPPRARGHRHPPPRRRGLPRADEEGRHPAEHLARQRRR